MLASKLVRPLLIPALLAGPLAKDQITLACLAVSAFVQSSLFYMYGPPPNPDGYEEIEQM